MDLSMMFQDVTRELCESGGKGKDAGKYMRIERCPPPGYVDIVLLESEEMDVRPEAGVVNDHAQHQESGQTQNHIGE